MKYYRFIPEKNWAISSLEHPKGKPRNLTQPSSIAFSRFKPDRLTTHSISPRVALKTGMTNPNKTSFFYAVGESVLMSIFFFLLLVVELPAEDCIGVDTG